MAQRQRFAMVGAPGWPADPAPRAAKPLELLRSVGNGEVSPPPNPAEGWARVGRPALARTGRALRPCGRSALRPAVPLLCGTKQTLPAMAAGPMTCAARATNNAARWHSPGTVKPCHHKRQQVIERYIYLYIFPSLAQWHSTIPTCARACIRLARLFAVPACQGAVLRGISGAWPAQLCRALSVPLCHLKPAGKPTMRERRPASRRAGGNRPRIGAAGKGAAVPASGELARRKPASPAKRRPSCRARAWPARAPDRLPGQGAADASAGRPVGPGHGEGAPCAGWPGRARALRVRANILYFGGLHARAMCPM